MGFVTKGGKIVPSRNLQNFSKELEYTKDMEIAFAGVIKALDKVNHMKQNYIEHNESEKADKLLNF